MKLIVQIPALNERDTIADVLAAIPRHIPGVGCVEVLIVDDGCTDDTVQVALAHGADHVVHHSGNKGLARAYQTGIDAALRLGADIIVNTDGDHQYPGSEIPRLIAPILAGSAEVVIGDRQVDSNAHFSPFKRRLQRLGSGVVRWASGTDVPDTVSGFRALSREAALRTFVTTDFSYTVENLIQAGKNRLTITTVPIHTNAVTRPSKLHRGNWHFIKRQASIIVRTYATYEPLRTFSYLATPFLLLGVVGLGRWFYVFLARSVISYLAANTTWRIRNYEADATQALILGGVFLILGLFIMLFGLLADRIGGQRRIEEEILYRNRKQEIEDEAWRREVLAHEEAILSQMQQRQAVEEQWRRDVLAQQAALAARLAQIERAQLADGLPRNGEGQARER